MKWTPETVTAQRRPEAMARAYMEWRQLNAVLDLLPRHGSAADIGAGFGRLCLVLRDRFDRVTGFEREPGLVKDARRILPDVEFVQVQRLTRLPVKDGAYDFAMTFTVLQHMERKEAKGVIAEIKRIVRPDGHVLIVEDTDPTYAKRNPKDAAHFTYGRSVRWHREQMAPFRLMHVSRRPNEAGFTYQDRPRPYAGHYMLFAGSEVAA